MLKKKTARFYESRRFVARDSLSISLSLSLSEPIVCVFSSGARVRAGVRGAERRVDAAAHTAAHAGLCRGSEPFPSLGGFLVSRTRLKEGFLRLRKRARAARPFVDESG